MIMRNAFFRTVLIVPLLLMHGIAFGQATAPTLTWATPAAIVYGTALSSTQLDATASVAGTFAYTPAAGALLSAGTQPLSVTFTPTDTTDYSTATMTVNITVNQASPTVTWATPAAIVYGTALSTTQLDATASVAGTFAYTPAAGTVLAPGAQTLSVAFTPTDTTDYQSVPKTTVDITVNKAPPTITWAAPAAIVYGTALSTTQLDATASVAGTFTYTPAAGTVLSAGTQTLSVTFKPTNTTDNLSATKTVSLTVNPASPTVTWATPAAIVYGTALSSTQLNATASVAGTFAYTPSAGTVLSAGTQTLSVAFTPTDTTDYLSASKTVNITVNQALPTISWVTPAAIALGATLGSTQLNATASVAGTFAYTPPAGTVLSLGTQTLSVTFTPTDTTDYLSASKTVSITVSQALPTITWATPAAIVYGTALNSTQLNATASVPGTFTYSPSAGTVLSAGTQTLSVTFAPTDTTHYLSASKTVSITVNQALPTITWATPAAIAPGVALGSTQLNATASAQLNGATANVPGTFTYTPVAGTVLAMGTNTLTVAFEPTDRIDFLSATGSVTITVGTVQPVVTFQGPSTSASAAQPVLTFGVSSFPVSLLATLTLTFASSTSPAMDDPSVQFASGGRTQTETVPANSAFSVNVPVQTGTIAGTLTITATLSANGTDVTPSSLAPVTIQLPPSMPVINSVVLTRNADTLQVAIIGYSNTRELMQAQFQFTAAPGSTLQTPEVTVSESDLFSGWFQNAASDALGSAFLYTAPFTISGSSADIGSVTVTLTNSVGTSAAATAQ